MIPSDHNNPSHTPCALPFPSSLRCCPNPPEELLFTILHSDSWEIRLIDSGTLADGGSRHGDRLNSECGMNATGRMGVEERGGLGGRPKSN